MFTDSVNSQNYIMYTGSKVSSYWPYIIGQNSDGSGALVEVKFYRDQGFQVAPVFIYAKNQSKFAVVPISPNYTTIANLGGYGIFYVTPSGQLAATIPHASTMGADQLESWPPSKLYKSPSKYMAMIQEA